MASLDLVGSIPASLFVDAVGALPSTLVDLTHDSRQVRPGWAFACVPGERFDGHDFAAAAVGAGASVLLVERPLTLSGGVPQIVVSDVRRAMGYVSAEVHGRPAERLTMIGVTGTNGKTTTTRLLGEILRAAGRRHREMGTLSGARTTPEAPDLQRQLAGFVADGVDTVVMEVSSHALALHRVAGTRFDVAVFTNLGRDHLDLHESMEAYFRAKASLFTAELSDLGVTNVDDPHGRLLLDAATIPMLPYGRADATDVEIGLDHHGFVWRGHRFDVPIGGEFNLLNSLAALTAADALGVDPASASSGLAATPSVPGRFEVITRADESVSVVVDYAHTPEGLAQVLASARATSDGKVIVVFGCGGDRDTDKRPLMGAAAMSADLVIITSDNPRHEDPMRIATDIIDGIDAHHRESCSIELDRRVAIAAAIAAARPGDVVVIAGKGHETTQTTGDHARPFDDRVVARELLDEAGENQ